VAFPGKGRTAHLDDIYRKFAIKAWFSLPFPKTAPAARSKSSSYIRSKQFAATVLLDPDGQALKKFFGANTLPYTVLIDRDGHIVRNLYRLCRRQEKKSKTWSHNCVQPRRRDDRIALQRRFPTKKPDRHPAFCNRPAFCREPCSGVESGDARSL